MTTTTTAAAAAAAISFSSIGLFFPEITPG